MKTKRAILYTLICLCTTLISGQGIVKRQTFSANLSAYVGTWVYVNDSIEFKISLKEGTKDTKVSFGTCLIGDYYFSQNDIVLDNYNISDIPNLYNDLNRESIVIYASNGKYISIEYANPNKLHMYFFDKQKSKRTYSGEIRLISTTQIRWILKDDEGDYNYEDWVELGFSVPTDVILTKQ